VFSENRYGEAARFPAADRAPQSGFSRSITGCRRSGAHGRPADKRPASRRSDDAVL